MDWLLYFSVLQVDPQFFSLHFLLIVFQSRLGRQPVTTFIKGSLTSDHAMRKGHCLPGSEGPPIHTLSKRNVKVGLHMSPAVLGQQMATECSSSFSFFSSLLILVA